MVLQDLAKLARRLTVICLGASSVAVAVDESELVCPKDQKPPPHIERADVYRHMPFDAGENAEYELTWAGLLAGYGTLEVRKPIKHRDRWHRVFHISAKTGDWFKAVFVAREEVEAISQPWNFGVAKFYLSQNEGKILAQPFVQNKWLEFDHTQCVVNERVEVPGKPDVRASFPLAHGAIDALGVVYELRTRKFELNKVERALVYTSEKNWWLEATPVAFEKVKVPAGEFAAVKLRLQTFIGKQMQQKGEVFAWYATETAQKPLVQLQGDIKIGKIWLKLHKFVAGDFTAPQKMGLK